MTLLWHLRNELRLQLYLMRRYWFESVFALLFLLLFFGGLVTALLVVSEAEFQSGKLDGFLVGFALWLYANTAYASASYDVAEDMRARTIEQLCVGPLPLWALLGTRALLRMLGGTLTLGVMLVVVAWMTAGRHPLRYGEVLGMALLAAPSLAGFGYLMAGILLVAKKAQTAQSLAYPVLIALVALPAYPVNGLGVLPYALGAAAARAASGGSEVPPFVYLLVAFNSAVWLGLGVMAFRTFEEMARRKGLLGHL